MKMYVISVTNLKRMWTMAKTSLDYDTRTMTAAELKKWKPPVMTDAEKKQMAKTEPWFTFMMTTEIIQKGKTKHDDAVMKPKKGKRAAKVVEKYLKEKNTAKPVEKKPRGRPKKKGK